VLKVRDQFDADAAVKNVFFPPGFTAEMLAADPDTFRPEYVVAQKFWTDLRRVLAENPKVGPDAYVMA
jgi:hypothetical protein